MMKKELRLEDVLKDMELGNSIIVPEGSLVLKNDMFYVISSLLDEKATNISKDEAYSLINKYLENVNLNNFLYDVVEILRKTSSIRCSVSEGTNFFSKHLVLNDSGYIAKLKRCDEYDKEISNGDYVYAICMYKEMQVGENHFDFEKIKNLDGIKEVRERFQNSTGITSKKSCIHVATIEFNRPISSKTEDSALTELISKVLINLL